MQKFREPEKDTLPVVLSSWLWALNNVSLSEKVLREGAWRYWVPEARVVVGSDGLDRQKRYVSQWLKIRDAWYYLLRCHFEHRGQLEAVKGPHWRDFLNGREETENASKDGEPPHSDVVQRHAPALERQGSAHDETKPKGKSSRAKAKRAQERRQGTDIVHRILAELKPDLSLPARWFGQEIGPLVGADWHDVARQIAWELAEVGFRFELAELDAYLVPHTSTSSVQQRQQLLSRVFPSDRELIPKTVPAANEGLAATDMAVRARYLEALRAVVCRWPDVPEGLRICVPFTSMASHILVADKEKELALFYCKSFFHVSGRAPILFRCVP